MLPCQLRSLFLLAIIFATAGWSRPSQGSLIFSFDSPSYAIANIGGTASVGLYVAQVPGTGPVINAANPLLTGGVQITFATTGAATETNFTASPKWDNSSVGNTINGSNTVVSLTVLSLLGVSDLSTPLLLGTFTFTGRTLGSTMALAATIHPGINFIDRNGDNLDPTNTPTALIRVGPATSVPEPTSLILTIIGAVSGLGGLGRAKKLRIRHEAKRN